MREKAEETGCLPVPPPRLPGLRRLALLLPCEASRRFHARLRRFQASSHVRRKIYTSSSAHPGNALVVVARKGGPLLATKPVTGRRVIP